MEYRTIRYVLFILKSQLRHRAKVCHLISQQKQNQFELLEHVLGSHIFKVIVICHSLFSSLSKSVANGSILSSHLLYIAHVRYLNRLQCSHVLIVFFQFLEELREAMFMCRKRICYVVSVPWIMVT